MKPEELKQIFVEWYNNNCIDTDNPNEMHLDEVYCVWYSLISTTRPDHMYYELTYDTRFPETPRIHVDAYLKVKHDELPCF